MVWRGHPSPRAQLPTYAALALGTLVVVGGIVFLARAGEAEGRGGRSLAPLVPWIVALALLGVLAVGVATYVVSRSTRYTLTAERLRVTTGILSTTTQELELRRVRDTVVAQPFLLRLLGLGHVALISADASTPRVSLRAIPDPEAVQSTIRSLVQAAYQRGAVREVDVL